MNKSHCEDTKWEGAPEHGSELQRTNREGVRGPRLASLAQAKVQTWQQQHLLLVVVGVAEAISDSVEEELVKHGMEHSGDGLVALCDITPRQGLRDHLPDSLLEPRY